VRSLNETIVSLSSASSVAQALLSAATDKHSYAVSMAVKDAKVEERSYYSTILKKERKKGEQRKSENMISMNELALGSIVSLWVCDIIIRRKFMVLTS
jgi:hypothetical protein